MQDLIERISAAYIGEGLAIVGEGISAARVELLARQAGLQLGPLEAADLGALPRLDQLLHQELHDLEAASERSSHDHASESCEHGHDHHQAHGHDHSHDHAHDHGHDHAHEHDHGHEHGHGHEHEHSHDHTHGSQRAHTHDHGEAQRGNANAPLAFPHGVADSADVKRSATSGLVKEIRRVAVGGAQSQQEPSKAPAKKAHRHKVKSKRFAESAVYVLEKMSHGFRRMGKATGGGFYDYQDDQGKSLWTGLKSFERGQNETSDQELIDRLLYAMVVEAARCQNDGASRADIDSASVRAGFPTSEIGAGSWIVHHGIKAVVTRLEQLEERHGERFAPPSELRRLAAAEI